MSIFLFFLFLHSLDDPNYGLGADVSGGAGLLLQEVQHGLQHVAGEESAVDGAHGERPAQPGDSARGQPAGSVEHLRRHAQRHGHRGISLEDNTKHL